MSKRTRERTSNVTDGEGRVLYDGVGRPGCLECAKKNRSSKRIPWQGTKPGSHKPGHPLLRRLDFYCEKEGKLWEGLEKGCGLADLHFKGQLLQEVGIRPESCGVRQACLETSGCRWQMPQYR